MVAAGAEAGADVAAGAAVTEGVEMTAVGATETAEAGEAAEAATTAGEQVAKKGLKDAIKQIAKNAIKKGAKKGAKEEAESVEKDAAKQVAKKEVKQVVKKEVKQEAKKTVKQESKDAVKQVAKKEAKTDVKKAAEQVAKGDAKDDAEESASNVAKDGNDEAKADLSEVHDDAPLNEDADMPNPSEDAHPPEESPDANGGEPTEGDMDGMEQPDEGTGENADPDEEDIGENEEEEEDEDEDEAKKEKKCNAGGIGKVVGAVGGGVGGGIAGGIYGSKAMEKVTGKRLSGFDEAAGGLAGGYAADKIGAKIGNTLGSKVKFGGAGCRSGKNAKRWLKNVGKKGKTFKIMGRVIRVDVEGVAKGAAALIGAGGMGYMVYQAASALYCNMKYGIQSNMWTGLCECNSILTKTTKGKTCAKKGEAGYNKSCTDGWFDQMGKCDPKLKAKGLCKEVGGVAYNKTTTESFAGTVRSGPFGIGGSQFGDGSNSGYSNPKLVDGYYFCEKTVGPTGPQAKFPLPPTNGPQPNTFTRGNIDALNAAVAQNEPPTDSAIYEFPFFEPTALLLAAAAIELQT